MSEALRPLGLVPLWLGAGAIATGLGAAIWYARAGLTLSHYDAKAHLVVSRRILDSLTPGWEQIGAVWLPLPHLVNMLPVQIDYFYRTGSFAVALSIVQHGITTAALAATVQALTASRTGAALAALLYALNPNVLYLQSTPMTEPLLFALTTLQVWLFARWVMAGRLTMRADAGWVTVLACLTRYEAWSITAACFVGAAYAWWRRGHSVRAVARVMSRLAVYPLATVALFLVFSRITVGEWFVSGGFFVPDETLRGQPLAVIEKIAEGVELLAGVWLLRVAGLAALAVGLLALGTAGRAGMVLTLAPFAAAALPFAAYLSGHPFRMRYEIPLVVACALVVGAGVGLLRRVAPVAAVGILALVVWEQGPLDQRAPMIAEAQLDPNVAARAQVTSCLVERYRGGTIMMSMGSLGHYMQEMSAAGFAIKRLPPRGQRADLGQRVHARPGAAGGVGDGRGVRGGRRRGGTAPPRLSQAPGGLRSGLRGRQRRPLPTKRPQRLRDAEIVCISRLRARSESAMSTPTTIKIVSGLCVSVAESESNPKRRHVVEAAQIDFRAEEVELVEIALGFLIANFAAERCRCRPARAVRTRRRAQSTCRSASSCRGRSGSPAAEVDEVAGLAVAPVEDPDAAADVRLHRGAAAERQHPDRGGESARCAASAAVRSRVPSGRTKSS